MELNRTDANLRRTQFDADVAGGLAAEGDFGAVNLEHARIATGGGAAGLDETAGEEAELHQAAGELLGKIEAGDDGLLAAAEVGEAGIAFATELHLPMSMLLGSGVCQWWRGWGSARIAVGKEDMPVPETTAGKLANYVLFASGQRGLRVTNLKLQKLLYYCQAWHLAFTGAELFPERIEAWVHGPVVPPVFAAFKEHRWNNLPVPVLEPEIETGRTDRPIRDLVAEVLEVYGHFTGAELEGLTHLEEPWRAARNGIPSDAPSNAVISHECMRKHYQDKLAVVS